MNLAPVVGLLERRIGLDPTSLGPTVLPAAVADRMRACGCTDVTGYAARVAERPDEFAALADRLIVPETWFFRGGGLFDYLAREAAGRPAFAALSLPCSSGEEPYSLAMALLDAGLDPERWAITGMDLSPRLIAAAGRGVYREFSFRQMDAGVRGRYFRASADGWELDRQARERVTFRVGNVLDLDDAGGYDLVLCRNLLIYLTPAARQRAVATLERLLAPDGLLALGHAEPPVVAGRAFQPVGPESYFLFKKGPPSPPLRGRGDGGEGVRLSPTILRSDLCESLTPSPPSPRPRSGGEGGKKGTDSPLTRARRLADAGRLDAAATELHAVTSADAFSLLGVIHEARGDRDAALDAFRKALYLDPAHREALTHAMLLAAQSGDLGRAAALRERLTRIGGAS